MSSSVPETGRQRSRSARARRVVGSALLSGGLIAGLGAFAYADPAAAGPSTGATAVVGGGLTWGLTQTFQGEPPSARPSMTVGGGATQKRDNTIAFPSAGGSYDSASGTAVMKYRGAVTLTYPAGKVTVANPTVTADRTGTALRADLDATANQPQSQAMTTERLKQADIADMALSSTAPRTAARTVTWSGVPTTLTATGASAFPDGFEGASLGSMTVAATLAAPAKPLANPAVANPAVKAPQARVAPTPNTSFPSLPAPNVSPNATSPGTGIATPGATDCPSPGVTASGTTSATTTPPGGTSSTAPTSTACPASQTPSATSSGPTSKLAKTGGPLAPLALAGAVLTVAGIATMMSSRRRGRAY